MACPNSEELDLAFEQLASYEYYHAKMRDGLSDTHKVAADEKRVTERAKVVTLLKADPSVLQDEKVKKAFDVLAEHEVGYEKYAKSPYVDSDSDGDALDTLYPDMIRDARKNVVSTVQAAAKAPEARDADEGPAQKRARV